METFKTTIRCAVIVFVAIAGGISFVGLSPTYKADAEAIAAESRAFASESRAKESNLTAAKKNKALTAEL